MENNNSLLSQSFTESTPKQLDKTLLFGFQTNPFPSSNNNSSIFPTPMDQNNDTRLPNQPISYAYPVHHFQQQHHHSQMMTSNNVGNHIAPATNTTITPNAPHFQGTIYPDFPSRATDYLPKLFEFFHNSHDFCITTQNAVGLRFLAKYYRVVGLEQTVWDFIKNDMKFDNLGIYLTDANYFGDEQVATWVSFECARYINKFDVASEHSLKVLLGLCPDNFKHFVFLARNCQLGNSKHTSELVGVYCSYHLSKLNSRWFAEVTSQQNLPVISEKVAMRLIEIEMVMKGSRRSVPSQQQQSQVTYQPLTSLQKRCVKTFTNTEAN